MNLRKTLLSLIVFVFSTMSVYSQSWDGGMQKQAWLGKNDSLRIKAFLFLNNTYWNSTGDSLRKGLAGLYEAHKIAQKNHFAELEIECDLSIANDLNAMGDISKSIEFMYAALRKSEKVKYTMGIANSNMNIGLLLFTQSHYKRAIAYFSEALKFQQKNSVQELTLIYLLGLCEMKTQLYAMSETHLLNALELAKTLQKMQRTNELYMALGELNFHLGKFKIAEEYCNKALPYHIQNEEYMGLNWIYSTLAELNLQSGNLVSAEAFGIKANYFAEHYMYKPQLVVASDLLYRIYKKKNDISKAYFFLSRRDSMQKVVAGNEVSLDIALVQAGYEYEKKEATSKAEQERKVATYKLLLELQKRKKNQATGIAIIVALILIGSAFAYRSLSKQRQVSEKLLLNILPKETALELKKYGKAMPHIHEDVTIMFCDVKGFTILAEKLSPEQLVNILDRYFRKFDTIMDEFGLEKIKTIGDAYMCASGLHSKSENSAMKTILAAKAMLTFNKEVEIEMQDLYNCYFQFRIGIHSGKVVSGVVGQNKYSYDIWGDAVNVAARMEQNSEPGRINITGQTFTKLNGEIACEYRGKIPAKNKGVIDMYFVS